MKNETRDEDLIAARTPPSPNPPARLDPAVAVRTILQRLGVGYTRWLHDAGTQPISRQIDRRFTPTVGRSTQLAENFPVVLRGEPQAPACAAGFGQLQIEQLQAAQRAGTLGPIGQRIDQLLDRLDFLARLDLRRDKARVL